MTRHATLVDVAQLAGVSRTAASVALNAGPVSRLSVETVQRVHDAARALGYRPNPAARDLRRGTTRTVCVISDEVVITRYASAMITGALDVAHESGHTLLISEANGEPERMRQAVESTLDRRADGLIFALTAARMVELPPLPPLMKVVLLNATGSKGEPSVLPAEYEAGSAIATELLQAGHRAIAVLGHPPDDWLRALHTVTVGTRLNGIRAALRQAGVEPALRLDATHWEPEIGYELTQQVLARHRPRVTALLCLNDRLAFGAYQALLEHGVSIPGEMSVVSFDDDEIARHLRPGLTTAGIPYREMGRRAMTMLLDGEVPDAPVQLPMPVHRRQSVAPPGRTPLPTPLC